MLRSYLLTALRVLRRRKGYAFINVAGLAVGLACFLLIYLFVQHERSYDRFHANADRIVRVGMTWVFDQTELPVAPTTTLPGPWLTENLPEVVDYVRLRRSSSSVVRVGDRTFKEKGFVHADSSLFSVFSFPLEHGDPRTALTRPHTVVLTASTARKYFGDADPVGRTLVLNDADTYEVTGVMADVPSNSHIQFDLAASFASLPEAQDRSWNSSAYHTYLLLTGPTAVARVRAAVPDLVRGYFPEGFANAPRLHITPLADVYLHGDLGGEWSPEGDVRYVYLFSAVALLILLIACVNYMNLATARAVDRAREVGVRKVLGARRRQLLWQFMGEAVLVTGVGLALAVALAWALLPVFGTLAGKTPAWSLGGLVPLLLGTWLVVSLLAGGYPALALSGFQPVRVLKGRFRASASGVRLRKGLVVFQFAVSTALIASTLVIYGQLRYIQHKELGYDRAHVVALPVDRAMRGRVETLKQNLAAHATVERVAASADLPVEVGAARTYNAGTDEAERQLITTLEMDEDVAALLGLRLRSGTGFTAADVPDDPLAEQRYVLLNETAARHFGWTPEEAVGKMLRSAALGGAMCTVKGVVADFHFATLHQAIEPLVMLAGPQANYLLVRTAPGDVTAALADVRGVWERLVPDRPFDYQFLDAAYAEAYRAEQQVGRLFGAFALLAVFVACLGLLGLAAFAVVQRTKEIGIRKVLGASPGRIVVLLSREFLVLVGVAFVVGGPVAYLAMERWLADFAYRAPLNLSLFLAAGLLTALLAFATVSYHALRAAQADPVKSLRYE